MLKIVNKVYVIMCERWEHNFEYAENDAYYLVEKTIKGVYNSEEKAQKAMEKIYNEFVDTYTTDIKRKVIQEDKCAFEIDIQYVDYLYRVEEHFVN